MREISAKTIEQTVYDLILQANYRIGPDIEGGVRAARENEATPTGTAV